MRIAKDIQMATQQLMAQLKKSETALNSSSNANVALANGSAITSGPISDGAQQALTLVKDSGYTLDDKSIQAISEYMDQAPGTTAEKLDALSVALSKEIPLSAEALNAIRVSRTGSLVDYVQPADSRPKSKASHQTTSSVRANEVRANGNIEEKSSFESIEEIDVLDAFRMKDALAQIDELLFTLLEELSTEHGDNLVKSVDKSGIFPSSIGISEEVLGDNKSARLSLSVLEVALNSESVSLISDKTDQEVAEDPLERVEATQEHDDKTSPIESEVSASGSVDELLKAFEMLREAVEIMSNSEGNTVSLPVQGRMVLEQKVTPHLYEVKQRFDQRVKQISTQLERLIQDNSSVNDLQKQPYMSGKMTSEDKVKQLDRLVDQLDQVVMKSEASLYLSMKSEKQLIKLSTQIDNAKQLLMRGKVHEVETQVKEVVTALKQLSLEPTLKKVLGLPSYAQQDDLETTYKNFSEGFKQFAGVEKSGTGILQWMRRLGLNYEPELYQKAFGERFAKIPSSGAADFEQMPLSLKEKLIKLINTQNTTTTGSSENSVKDAIQHLTGQQLSNKIGDKPVLQQLNFSIPVSVQGRVEEMKVWLQTPQENLKADWKNFDMFFMLKTQVVGEVGIKVRSVDLKLSVEVINDHVRRESIFTPLVKALMEDIGDMGFTATRVTFSGWHQKSPVDVKLEDKTLTPKQENQERGFDVKI